MLSHLPSKEEKALHPERKRLDAAPNALSTKASDCCKTQACLLLNTPRVGVFDLVPRSMKDSLLGKTEEGKSFKFGSGRVTQGNTKAARDLLNREFPQVKLALRCAWLPLQLL